MTHKFSKVLVTGGAGFLGRVVTRQFCERGAEVVAPRSAQCDLRDAERVKTLLEECQPDLVVHLAARVGGIGANRANPGRYFYDNLMMGLNIMEQGRICGVPRTVLAGTICAYPKFAPVPFREEDLWSGFPEETNAPYGVAKKSLFVMAEAYRQQYGTDTVCLLPVNLYGPGDNFDLDTSHVIPALIRKCTEARREGRAEVTLWGDGTPTREFLYVDDCARAIVLAAETCQVCEPINVGTGHEISIRSLAEKIAEASGFEGRFVWDESKPNGQPRRCLDVSRAKSAFGFEAAIGLDDGIRRTVAWFQDQQNGS